MSKVKIRVWEDRMGNILGCPVRKDIQDKIVNHIEEMTAFADHRFFFQEGMEAEEFKEQNLSPRQKREIEAGWDVYINMDLWELGHRYGWDTHAIFE